MTGGGFDREFERPPKRERPLEYITVPAGTRASQCRGRDCRAVIYWIERESRSRAKPEKIVHIPVDCEHTEQCVAPTDVVDGIGVNHFQTCPNANRF